MIATKEACPRPWKLAGLMALGASIACLAGCGGGRARVTFSFRPPPGDATSVSVAGTFNQWSYMANPLQDDDRDGVWEATCHLPPGRIEYKFVVNTSRWCTDSTATEFAPDGFGGQNSVATIPARGDLVIGSRTPFHVARAPRPYWQEVTFRYRPAPGGATSVSVVGTFNAWNVKANPLQDDDGDGVWEGTVRLSVGRVEYRFVINEQRWCVDWSAAEFAPIAGNWGVNSVAMIRRGRNVVGSDAPFRALPEPRPGWREATFRYRPAARPNSVCLVGDFNGWLVGLTPLVDPDGDGEYAARVALPAADWAYVFVANDTLTFLDELGQDSTVTWDKKPLSLARLGGRRAIAGTGRTQ